MTDETGKIGDGNDADPGQENSKPDDYVGYGHPPKCHQFKPGQSGNPKGRRKASLGLKTLLRKELSEKIRITEQGKTKSISKFELMVKRLTEKGAKGDFKSIEKLLSLSQGFGFDDQEDAASMLNSDERAIIEDLQRRRAEAADTAHIDRLATAPPESGEDE